MTVFLEQRNIIQIIHLLSANLMLNNSHLLKLNLKTHETNSINRNYLDATLAARSPANTFSNIPQNSINLRGVRGAHSTTVERSLSLFRFRGTRFPVKNIQLGNSVGSMSHGKSSWIRVDLHRFQ